MGQLNRKRQQREMDWVKRQTEEAKNNAVAGIEDYTAASWFDLRAAASIGDEAAKLELDARASRAV